MSSLNTIPQIFLDRTAKSAARQAIGWIENNQIQSWDFAAYRHAVESFSLALRKHGLQPQEKLAILSSTRREWNVTDLAAQCARGIVVPVYPSYLPDEVAFIVKHSESCMIAVEDETQLAKVLRIYDELPPQKLLIAFSPIGESLRQALAAKRRPGPAHFCGAARGGCGGSGRPTGRLRGNDPQPAAQGRLDHHLHLRHHGRTKGRGHHAVRVVAQPAERA